MSGYVLRNSNRKRTTNDLEECELALKEIKLEIKCDEEEDNNQENGVLSMLPPDCLPPEDIKVEMPDSTECTPDEEAMMDAQIEDIIANITIDTPPKMEIMYAALQNQIKCLQERSDWLLSEHKIQKAQLGQMEQAYYARDDAAKHLQLMIEKGPLAVPNISMDDICNSMLQLEQTKQEINQKRTKVEELNREVNSINYRIGQALAQRTALERHAETCRQRARGFNDHVFTLIDNLVNVNDNNKK